MSEENAISQNEILIVGLTLYFLEKPVLWFSENFAKIKSQNQTQSWWQNQTLFLEKDQTIALSYFLRRLDELGYEKVQKISSPGEFARFGGTIEIFPINSGQPFRIEFFGNKIDNIISLSLEIKDEERQKILKRKIKQNPSEILNNLQIGDYVVHLDHGIGIYRGQEQIKLSQEKENQLELKSYYIIEYAPPREGKSPDRLYLPENQLQKLDRYIGLSSPKIHRLGGELWIKTKNKIREDVEKFAKELLETYAERAIKKRTPYPSDDRVQKEFEETFEHIETDGQLKAMDDIKKDMESELPMDRLVCGDVGFGKTEVAVRAAFKAAWNGRQVAFLCPTTILADQHFQTLKERLKNFPLKAAVLSRFESAKSQLETIKKLKTGVIDIVVGTHRLLSKDIEFKNLGLLIIDEEQKFGVKQKEKLKKFKNEVDILNLSATPIPRTLQMSLSGLHPLSLITSPPPGRRQIETNILPYSKKIIKQAIEEEIKREGQVYFLHNRVETIGKAVLDLKKLVKRAKIESAHGKMSEEQLRRVMNDFRQKKFNVLVATTIIENGLDLPQVNTLIVTNCAKLGLAQSYQIRGRIGRSDKKAFAYFLYSDQKLSEKAALRLEALKRAEALGSGYQLAQADLEIRGAGNILGKEQSGSVNQIGLNLYCNMLNEAVERLKT